MRLFPSLGLVGLGRYAVACSVVGTAVLVLVLSAWISVARAISADRIASDLRLPFSTSKTYERDLPSLLATRVVAPYRLLRILRASDLVIILVALFLSAYSVLT